MAPIATSLVWKYFSKVDSTGANCIQRSKFIKCSGDTSNFMKHLKTHNVTLAKSTKTSQAITQAIKRRRISEDDVLEIS